MKLGNVTINKVYLGATQINKICLGTTDVLGSNPGITGTFTANSLTPNEGDDLVFTFTQTSINHTYTANDYSITSPATLVLTATSSLIYQLLKDGIPVSGATNAINTLSSVDETDDGDYTLVVTNTNTGYSETFGPLSVAVVSAPGQTFIQASDFTFLGGFRVPNIYPINDPAFTYGLTHRYKDGNFRLLSASKGATTTSSLVHLLEYSVPTLNPTTGTYVTASVTTNYGGGFWQDKMSFVSDRLARSIYWDETSQQLFFFSLSAYVTGTVNTIGIAILNESNPSASTIRGKFRLAELSYKATKGACSIPTSMQSRVGGKSIAIGFGGYESIVSNGPAHMGPAMAAVDPDIFIGAPDESIVSGSELFISHPWSNNTHYTSPWRGLRDPNTWAISDGTVVAPNTWNPVDDVGYFNAMDWIDQGAVWIDTPTKKGFLLFCTLSGNGSRANIVSSTYVSDNGPAEGSFYVYDIVLDQPLLNASTSHALFVKNTYGNYTKSNVTSITNGGLNLRVHMERRSQQNGPIAPAPSTDVYYGANYFGSGIYASFSTTTMLCYDPEQILAKNTNPLPIVSCESFLGPNRVPFGTNTSGQRILGATFDTVTNRLYLLQAGGFVGVYQLN